jgi:hypothetical protein
MHGGLFKDDNVTLDDLRKIDRNRQPPESGKSMDSVLGPVLLKNLRLRPKSSDDRKILSDE